jgi:drug/metabolite transporter (DMT)-like permease
VDELSLKNSNPAETITDLNKERFVGIIFVLIAQFLFGTTFAVNKFVIAVEGVNPVVMAHNRTFLVLICLFPFLKRCKGSTVWSWMDWKRVMFIGGVAYSGAMMFEYYGTRFTTASNVSLIVSTEMVFSIFLAVLLLKEKLHIHTIIGGFCAFFGMGMVIYQDIQAAEFHINEALKGDLLVLGSVVGWGLYNIFSKKVLNHSDPIYTLFYVSLFSVLSLLMISIPTGDIFNMLSMSPKAWAGTVYLGIFGSCLGMVFYFQGLKRLPVSIAALTITLLPVFGVLCSMILLGESLSMIQVIGAIIIIISVGYVVYPRKGEVPITEDTLIGV